MNPISHCFGLQWGGQNYASNWHGRQHLTTYNFDTVDQELFAGKIFRLVLFLSLWPLNKINLLLFVEKYFSGLLFITEGDQRKIFHNKNFPIYGTDYTCMLIHKYRKKLLKKNRVCSNAYKRLKQVADVQCNALLHPYFTLMCNSTI